MTGPRTLLALHQAGAGDHLPAALAELGFRIEVSRNMAATWVAVRHQLPEAVVLAPLSRDIESAEFCSLLELADSPEGPALVVLTDDPGFLVRRVEAVHDFLPPDIGAERAARRLHFALERRRALLRLHTERDRLLQQSITDYKTGLFNDRYFAERGAAEVSRARRQELPIGMLMIDFDGFKAINDIHGHGFGDHALATFAAALRARLRDFDIPARMGGDEFAVLLPGSRLQDVIGVAERLRATVAALDLQHDGRRAALSVSIGAAAWLPRENLTLADVLHAADAALLAAKAQGRGRIGIAEAGGVRTLPVAMGAAPPIPAAPGRVETIAVAPIAPAGAAPAGTARAPAPGSTARGAS